MVDPSAGTSKGHAKIREFERDAWLLVLAREKILKEPLSTTIVVKIINVTTRRSVRPRNFLSIG